MCFPIWDPSRSDAHSVPGRSECDHRQTFPADHRSRPGTSRTYSTHSSRLFLSPQSTVNTRKELMYELHTGIKCPPDNPHGPFLIFSPLHRQKKAQIISAIGKSITGNKHSNADPDMLTNETKKIHLCKHKWCYDKYIVAFHESLFINSSITCNKS